MGSIKEMLLSKRQINEITGCWIWTGRVMPYNYGTVRVDGKSWAVHRLAYHEWIGPIPNGHVCRHRCDNPRCFNPDHLMTGTQSENNMDCVRSGRHAGAAKTHCKHGHEFTPENTHMNTKGHRVCKACQRRSWRKKTVPRPDRFTHCKRGHERTPENTYKEPNGGIKCRRCMRERLNRRRKMVLLEMKASPESISIRQ